MSYVNREPPSPRGATCADPFALSWRRNGEPDCRGPENDTSVLKWIDKALEMGVKAGMKDLPHQPFEALITDDAKAWVVHLA